MTYYSCKECGYIFPDKESAENHWRYDRTGQHSTTDYPEEGKELEEIE